MLQGIDSFMSFEERNFKITYKTYFGEIVTWLKPR